MSEEKIIPYDSVEAARLETVTVWMSSKGNGYKDESIARYDGCTHRPCQVCGALTKKHRLICDDCGYKKDREHYDTLPAKPYGGEPVYSKSCQEFFFGQEEIEDHLSEHESSLDDLMLVHCEPQYLSTFAYDDHYSGDLPEDRYLSDEWSELAEIFERANQLIAKEKRIMSWYPAKIRVDISTIKIEESEASE